MDADDPSGSRPRPRAGLGFERLPNVVGSAPSNGETLDGDRAIAEVLRSLDPDDDSPEWVQVRTAFIEYAFPQLVALGTTGQLHATARRRRARQLWRIPKDLRLDESSARLLAARMVARALRSFRRTALPRWDPTRGASLADYFVGCCLLQLVPAWHALWPTVDDAPPRHEVPTSPSDLPDVRSGGDWARDPAETVTSVLYVDVLMEKVKKQDPLTVPLIELRYRGYSLTEALHVLGEGSAMRSRLWRLRRTPALEEEPDG